MKKISIFLLLSFIFSFEKMVGSSIELKESERRQYNINFDKGSKLDNFTEDYQEVFLLTFIKSLENELKLLPLYLELASKLQAIINIEEKGSSKKVKIQLEEDKKLLEELILEIERLTVFEQSLKKKKGILKGMQQSSTPGLSLIDYTWEEKSY